jgi:hypothetical protein
MINRPASTNSYYNEEELYNFVLHFSQCCAVMFVIMFKIKR